MAVTAYTLGLRHAFDADLISAIDNTTRKVMNGFVIVGMFIFTWSVAMLVWRYGHIEEKWSSRLNTAPMTEFPTSPEPTGCQARLTCAIVSPNDAPLVDLVEGVLSAPRPWNVVQVGEPVLRQRAAQYDGQLPDALLQELLDAMHAHLPGIGVGLAAPQIGIPLALAVIEDAALVGPEVAAARERVVQPPLDLINPAVTPLGSEQRAFYEGCLSVIGLTAVVPRHRRIRLCALDRAGRAYDLEMSGWPARIAQHETDHLNGVLYLDRAEIRSLSTTDAYERYWAQPEPAAAAATLAFRL